MSKLVTLTASLILAANTHAAESSATVQTQGKPDTPTTEPCYVVAKLKQSRFSLDITQHAKDYLNSVDLRLPTACEKLQGLTEGQNLVDKFRLGSLLVTGSLGDWKLSVKQKPIIKTPELTSCRATFELSQGRYSLNPLQHLKDAANSMTFKWDVPCSVHDSMKVGDNILDKSFRWGSLVIDGSVGNWKLQVKEKHGPSPKA